MTRISCIFIAVVFFVRLVAGQEPEPATDWTQHVIPDAERSFDFKTVAKGTVSIHRFVLKNPFLEPIHIKAILSSCTCTTIDFNKEEQSVLKTYEEAVIPIRLQGDMFEGQRNSTITVIIDEPHRAEIQLNVRGEIRTDLNISPRDLIDFGNVELGKEQSRALTVTYKGSNTQWRIVDVKCENEFIRTTDVITETTRVGEKTFRLNVILDKSAPNGNLLTTLLLRSNDSEPRRDIPIPIRATVGTVINVTPKAFSLGILSPGEVSPTKSVILRGTRPFRITKIECDNPAIDIPLTVNADDPPKIVYSVPVVYRNPLEGEGAPKEGVMRAIVQITTDIPGLTPSFHVTANVRE
jgi:hypothetical protein